MARAAIPAAAPDRRKVNAPALHAHDLELGVAHEAAIGVEDGVATGIDPCSGRDARYAVAGSLEGTDFAGEIGGRWNVRVVFAFLHVWVLCPPGLVAGVRFDRATESEAGKGELDAELVPVDLAGIGNRDGIIRADSFPAALCHPELSFAVGVYRDCPRLNAAMSPGFPLTCAEVRIILRFSLRRRVLWISHSG